MVTGGTSHQHHQYLEYLDVMCSVCRYHEEKGYEKYVL